MSKRNVSESLKKRVAGMQLYKCANKNDIQLTGLTGYKCPLWNSSNNGSFDESGYDIDHIVEHVISGDDDISNLQALCKSCHMVKTKRFNSRHLKTGYIKENNDNKNNVNVGIINNGSTDNGLELYSFLSII